ncbi:hypothetical protein U3516DRAFT_478855, partial [Neocallimastix sp. 'constans']
NTSSPTSTKLVWIYNANLNECLCANTNITTGTKAYKPYIRACGNIEKFKWYFEPYPKGHLRSYLAPSECIYLEDVENGKIKVNTCEANKNFDFEYDLSTGSIKSPLSPQDCLGKGDRGKEESNADGGYLNPCIGSEDQVWQIWDMQPNTLFEAKTQDVWVYNPELNKCLVSGNKLNNRPQIGNCGNSDSFKWQIPESEDGFYKSLSTGWYLDVINIEQGTIIMNDTRSPSSVIKHSKKRQAIVSPLNSQKCLGIMSSTNKNEYRLTLNDCNNSQKDQKWEI